MYEYDVLFPLLIICQSFFKIEFHVHVEIDLLKHDDIIILVVLIIVNSKRCVPWGLSFGVAIW